eukprot:s5579_g4.t1
MIANNPNSAKQAASPSAKAAGRSDSPGGGRSRAGRPPAPAQRVCREENFGLIFDRQHHVELEVSTVLRELRNIQGLRLVQCNLTDRWLAQLGHSGTSAKWSAVRLLDLRCNELTALSAPAIASVIAGGLQALLLDGNRLQIEGFQVLCNAMKAAGQKCALRLQGAIARPWPSFQHEQPPPVPHLTLRLGLESMYSLLMPTVPESATRLSLLWRWRARACSARTASSQSIFDRPRSLGRGAALHERVDGEPASPRASFPGRGDKRCKRGDGAGQHLQPWHTSSHLRGVNTEALPPAKWERKLNEVESKAPEHFVRAKGQLRDLADADRLLDAAAVQGLDNTTTNMPTFSLPTKLLPLPLKVSDANLPMPGLFSRHHELRICVLLWAGCSPPVLPRTKHH